MSLFKKNKEYNFEVDLSVLISKIDKYENEDIKIFSKKIKSIIDIDDAEKTDEEITYINNFVKISIFLDDKFKDDQFTSEQKELITEAVFSEFEYLKENKVAELDTLNKFLERLDENTTSVYIRHPFFDKLLSDENARFTNHKVAIANSYMKTFNSSLETDKDARFAELFAHEEVHSLSFCKNNTGIIDASFHLAILKPSFSDKGLNFQKNVMDITIPSFIRQKWGSDFVNLQNECFTESISFNMLQNNFSFLMEEKDNYFLSNDEEFSKINFRTKHESYKKCCFFSDVLLDMYKSELLDTYFNPNKNMLDFHNSISIDESNNIKTLFENYSEFIRSNCDYGTSTESVSINSFLKLEESFKNTVISYLSNNEISNKDYKELLNKIEKNPVYIDNNPFSENQILKEQISLEYEKEIIKSRNEVANKLSKSLSAPGLGD